MTPDLAVRRFCLSCLGVNSGHSAYDCASKVCPLYACMPFRGKRRRPSRAFIRAQCYQYQPGDRTDCQAAECALYPFRPWAGPGHVERRRSTAAQREAAARGRETVRQNATSAAGRALGAEVGV